MCPLWATWILLCDLIYFYSQNDHWDSYKPFTDRSLEQLSSVRTEPKWDPRTCTLSPVWPGALGCFSQLRLHIPPYFPSRLVSASIT